MANFREIEFGNGFNFPGWPVDPASMQGQHEIRRLAWCIQEELCEADEASDIESHLESRHKLLTHKEMIDALHFIAELMLTLGYWPEDLPPQPAIFMTEIYTLPAHLYITMTDLGKTINLCKSKPWKQSLKTFDEDQFKQKLSRFICSFFRTCYALGLNDEVIEMVYMGKAYENQERIDAGV
jgi:hypothetical protein